MSLRIVFFGTPAFAVPTLQRLIASRHDVAGVVTQPDRPRGRGQRVQPEAVKRAAIEAGLPVLQPERLKDPAALDAIRALGADLGVVAAYGKILPQAVLDMPRLGLINVHASLLPRWRGAAPIQRAILAGDTRTGVTIMRVVFALDAGPMLAHAEVAIDPDETSTELEVRLARIGADELVAVADALEDERASEVPQDESGVTYAARLTRADGVVDWTQPARKIHDQIRGLHPWPLVSVTWHGRRLILRRSRVLESASPDTAGIVSAIDRDGIVVGTGHGALTITELQAEGRPPMSSTAFLAGHPMKPGDVLTAWPVPSP